MVEMVFVSAPWDRLMLFIEVKIMNQCYDYSCPYRDTYSGCCKITACIMCRQNSIQPLYTANLDSIVFPQTIGNITFYSSKALIKWVEDQQKINKDTNYGIGNWC